MRSNPNAKPTRCRCGYEAKDQQDLEEHILILITGDDPPTGSLEHREER